MYPLKKIIQIVALIILVSGIPACSGGECSGIKAFFDVEGVVAENYLNNPSFNDSVSLQHDTVDEASYFIRADFITIYYSKVYPTLNPFSTQKAYALDCATPGGSGSKEGIDTIFIISKHKLSPNFTDNDTINSIIKIDNTTRSRYTLKEFIAKNKNTIYSQGFFCKVNTKIQNKSQPHSFTIVVRLGNGEQYSSTTSEVYFR